MKPENIKDWMKANRHSSYSFAKLLWDRHSLKVSPETVQRWMAGLAVSERYRQVVATETKLKLPKKLGKRKVKAGARP